MDRSKLARLSANVIAFANVNQKAKALVFLKLYLQEIGIDLNSITPEMEQEARNALIEKGKLDDTGRLAPK